MRKILISLVVTLSVVCSSLAAEAAEILPLSGVRKGMTGYGLTVFEGDKIEKFSVEIIGTLTNIGPQQNLILAKVDSAVLKNSGVIAGMSGSPIYIDGKIIGALAYAWQFAKDPIAGITPIEEMLQIRNRSAAAPASNAVKASAFLKDIVERDPVKLNAMFDQLMPRARALGQSGAMAIATPVSFSGFAADTLERYGKTLEMSNMMAVPAGSSNSGSTSSATDRTFREGDAIAAVLIDGDFSVAATGTVTYVDGQAVYGFGHPFLDMGTIDFPMAKAEVVGVLPNLARSFKFSNTGAVVGALRQDRLPGIMGYLGAEANTIPVEVTVDENNKPTTYKLRVVRHQQLFPLLLAMTADSVISTRERAAGERTVLLESEIKLAGHESISLREGWAGAQAREAIPAYLGVISAYLLSNEFSDASIEKVSIRIRHDDGLKTARILQAAVESPSDGEFNPGDTIKVRTVMKPFRGETFSETFEVKIPENQRAGRSYLMVGSGSMINRIDFMLVPPDPQNLSQVIEVVERLRPSTDLTVALYSATDGAVTSGVYLPELPPSLQAVVGDDATTGGPALVKYRAPNHYVKDVAAIVEGAIKIDVDVKPKS